MSTFPDSSEPSQPTSKSAAISQRKRIYSRKPVVRMNFRYNTTVVRVAEDDKIVFDRLVRYFADEVDERISHHEFFAVLMRDALERINDIVERFRRDPLPLSDERALAAMFAELEARRAAQHAESAD